MIHKTDRHPTYKPLNDEKVSQIHDATMNILSQVGFAVHNDRAWEIFSRFDVQRDSTNHIIRMKEHVIKDILSTVPPQITLYGKQPENDIQLGSGNVYFGTGGTALNILDYESQRCNPANMQDLIDIIRIVEEMDNIHLMLLPTYPNEIPSEIVDINRFFAGFAYSNKHIMGGVYTQKGIRDVITMAETIAGSPHKLREKPFLSMIACGISPLKLDGKYGDFMMQIAEAGIPVAVPAEPLCAATSPVTCAGNLVIQNCDALINVMLTQAINPATPVMYGCVASTTDMRKLSYLGGSIESALINAAAAQMAQHYGIPYYGTAGISDSKCIDAQCGYESALTNISVALAGADFIHDAAGLMEFAMTVSKEKLVMDNDILGMVGRAVDGIEVNQQTLALDLIADAGPGGNFVSSRHTRKYMHKEHYKPYLADRESRKQWTNDGAQTTEERAHEVVRRILSGPVDVMMDTGIAQKILDKFSGIVPVYYQEAIKL